MKKEITEDEEIEEMLRLPELPKLEGNDKLWLAGGLGLLIGWGFG